MADYQCSIPLPKLAEKMNGRGLAAKTKSTKYAVGRQLHTSRYQDMDEVSDVKD